MFSDDSPNLEDITATFQHLVFKGSLVFFITIYNTIYLILAHIIIDWYLNVWFKLFYCLKVYFQAQNYFCSFWPSIYF